MNQIKQEHDAKIEKAGGIFRTHVIIKIGDHYKLDFGICISETCYCIVVLFGDSTRCWRMAVRSPKDLIGACVGEVLPPGKDFLVLFFAFPFHV